MKWPKKLPQPMYIRASSKVRYMGKNYIVKRDISGAIYKLVGRITRKLPSMEEAIAATESQKLVCQWGGYYSAYVAIDQEEAPLILEYLWNEEKKRGIEPPDISEGPLLSDEG